jgi:hypothetical protein
LLAHASRLDGQQSDQIRTVLQTARGADGSLIHRTFQELVLGSAVYAQTYPYPALLGVESYLKKFDHPLLAQETAEAILRWREAPAQFAAIFTSRPSRPLPGVFSTPEAELGAALVGLGELPVIGLGSLLWLSEQRQAGPQAFLKPSPVHVLAASLSALKHPTLTCLQEAAALALDGKIEAIWTELAGAELTVFDDSPAGLGSAAAAQACLAQAGVQVTMNLVGIASDPQKIAALHRLGARTYPDIVTALEAPGVIL